MNTVERDAKYFPACLVKMPEGSEYRRAAFYLATEEFIAQQMPAGSYLFSWQLRPTVVMGRNQVAHQEVNLDFCQEENIDVIRRRSGGGAIYADEGNIMLSLITEGGAVEPLFKEYAETVAEALKEMGAPAEVSGRNDILLDTAPLSSPEGDSLDRGQDKKWAENNPETKGKAPSSKVCGNAFYHLANRNIVHGTMLYDTNPRLMEGALHPDTAKLESKGVKSVRKRVGLLKDYLKCDVCELRHHMEKRLTNRCITLSPEQVTAIEQLEQRYYEPEFLYGSSAASDATISGRIEGCGNIELHFSLKGSIINKVALQGDFFETGNATEAFNKAFVGCTFSKESLLEVLQKEHPEKSLRGGERFAEIFNEK